MADITNDDSIPYDKEKESFLRELQEFHEKRGTPFRDGPKISGRLVDLHQLYELVTSEGGWVKVNSRNDWDKVLQELKLPTDCVNCSVAVKQVYLRYLDRYEELYFFGEIEERGAGDDEEDSRNRKLTMRSLNSFPHMYNHMQHCVNESLRMCNGLSIDLYQPSEYDKLAMSLISPLANEQDFAINVCTLISHEGKHCLKLHKHRRILHYLLAHAAVFNHSGLRQVFCDHYNRVRGHSVTKFWHDIVCDTRLIRLIDETRFEVNEYEDDLTDDCLLSASEKSILSLRPEDSELFCIGRTFGTQEFVGQRVLQIATILRNLTFVQENLNIMCEDLTFLRFVLLCCGSNWSSLHQMGWDMLGNVAQDITILCPLMPEILDLTVQGLESTDRAQILASLEVLNKLGQNEKNEDYFLKYLKTRVYDRVCSFLSIQDIMMLIYTLECLYSLSSMGEKACDAILRVHGVLDTLVSLVTVEAQSYGPKACIQMKVVETVTGVAGTSIQNGSVSVTQTSVSNPSIATTSQTITIASTVQMQQLASVAPPSPRPQLVTQAQMLHPTNQAAQTQVVLQSPSKVTQTQVTHMTPTTTKLVQVVQSASNQVTQSQMIQVSPVLSKTAQTQVVSSLQTQTISSPQFHVAQAQVQTSQPPTQIHTPQVMQVQSRIALTPSSPSAPSPQQVVQENERFVLLWLKNTFEPNIGSRIEQQELYKKYIDYCVKIGRRGVIAPLHFPRYVRSVFGANVGPVAIPVSGEPTQQFFDGIRVRADSLCLPNPVTQITQTLSPLLKAQLSAPLKPTTTTQNKIIQRQTQQIIIQQQTSDNRQTICPSPTPTVAVQTPVSSVINSVIAQSISPSPSTAQAQISNISVIEKLPLTTTGASTQASVEENNPEKLNGATTMPESKTLIKKDDAMETDTLVTSTSTDNSNESKALTLASTCIKVTSSLKDHEYTDMSFPTATDIKREVPSTENSNDSTLVNGLSKSSDTEDSNSKDSAPKKLMLADLLEKNIDKSDPPLTNCSLRIGEKGLELVPGPEKEKPVPLANLLTSNSDPNGTIAPKEEIKILKRPGEEVQVQGSEVKKPRVNGNSPPGIKEDQPESVSSSAANLYAALAADALEDEQVEETPKPPVLVTAMNQPRQILLTTGSQIAQSVIVGGQHYIVAQPQTTLVQGQAQTVLVAQTSQQQGLGAKTIIFLQPQNVPGSNSQQKVLVQTANPPPLIATSQASSILRAKTPTSTSQTSPLLQQAILRQNMTKTIQLPGNIQSPQKPVIQQSAVAQQTTIQQPSAVQQSTVIQPQGVVQQHNIIQQQTVNQPVQTVQQLSTAQQTIHATSKQEVTPLTSPPVNSTSVATATTSTSPGPSNLGILPNTNPSASNSPSLLPQIKTAEKGRFLCEWRGCMRSFRSPSEVYIHACEVHCPDTPKDIQCLWQRCDTMKRKRFSHMTHLYNRHCNPEVMRIAAERSKQLTVAGRTEIPPPSPPMPHPGYAPNAALLAINRHASDYVNPKELQDENEGPVTKSIRLTSALILRNLVIFSSNGRRHLSRFEPHLANVALSGVESSRTIAHVLFDMSENRWHHLPT